MFFYFGVNILLSLAFVWLFRQCVNIMAAANIMMYLNLFWKTHIIFHQILWFTSGICNVYWEGLWLRLERCRIQHTYCDNSFTNSNENELLGSSTELLFPENGFSKKQTPLWILLLIKTTPRVKQQKVIFLFIKRVSFIKAKKITHMIHCFKKHNPVCLPTLQTDYV